MSTLFSALDAEKYEAKRGFNRDDDEFGWFAWEARSINAFEKGTFDAEELSDRLDAYDQMNKRARIAATSSGGALEASTEHAPSDTRPTPAQACPAALEPTLHPSASHTAPFVPSPVSDALETASASTSVKANEAFYDDATAALEVDLAVANHNLVKARETVLELKAELVQATVLHDEFAAMEGTVTDLITRVASLAKSAVNLPLDRRTRMAPTHQRTATKMGCGCRDVALAAGRRCAGPRHQQVCP